MSYFNKNHLILLALLSSLSVFGANANPSQATTSTEASSTSNSASGDNDTSADSANDEQADEGSDDMDFSDIPDNGGNDGNFSKGVYIGLAAGVGMDHWRRTAGRNLPYDAWTSTSLNRVKHDVQFAYQLKLGYAFTQQFSLEASYFGLPRNHLNLTPGGDISVSHNNGAILGRMGILFSKVWFYAKVGGGYMAEQFSNGIGNRYQWVPVIGLGDYYMINSHFAIGLDYTHFMNTAAMSSKHYMPSQDYGMLSLQINFPNKV